MLQQALPTPAAPAAHAASLKPPLHPPCPQDLGVADSTLAVAREVPDSTLLTLHMDLVRSYPTQVCFVGAAGCTAADAGGLQPEGPEGGPGCASALPQPPHALRGWPLTCLLCCCCPCSQLITAVNHVLYERHGYRRQRRHGDPLE